MLTSELLREVCFVGRNPRFRKLVEENFLPIGNESK